MFGKFLVYTRRCVEIWTKNILYGFNEGQTHFGMPRDAKMSLILNEPN